MIKLFGTFINGTQWEETADDREELEFILRKVHYNTAISSIDKIMTDDDGIPGWLWEHDEETGDDLADLVTEEI